MIEIEKQLKTWGLKRASDNVGKKIDKNIWLHKDYINDFITKENFEKYSQNIPSDFKYQIIRYNEKENEIMFIKASDFDNSHEPVIEDAYKVKLENNEYKTSYTKANEKNPLIYHHKWLFVKDDYKGFDVAKSKERSFEWKSVLGVNKELSNKIGRKDFWDKWLAENNLRGREENKMEEKELHEFKKDSDIQNFIEKKAKEKMDEVLNVWDIYLENKVTQSETSAKTARVQIPRSVKIIESFNLSQDYHKVLDIGCGSGNAPNKQAIESLGMEYKGCDPFNKTKEENLKVLKERWQGQSDLITLNNVLNTVPEKDVRNGILRQAKDAMKEKEGLLIVVTYEGEKTKEEKELEKSSGKRMSSLSPIKTRDGWQNRMKTQDYIEEIQEVFPNSLLVTKNGSKVIVATRDPEMDLEAKFNQSPKSKVRP